MVKRIVSIGMMMSLVALAGCGGVVEDTLDCDDICGDFDACLGDEVNALECRGACQNEPESEIEECDACLDSEGMTCSDCLVACAPLAT